MSNRAIVKLYETDGDVSCEALVSHLVGGKQKNDWIMGFMVVQYSISLLMRSVPIDNTSTIKDIIAKSKLNEGNGKEALKISYDFQRVEAEKYLILAKQYFELGRDAYLKTPNSFEGMRYYLEREMKRPVTADEAAKFKRISNAMHNTNSLNVTGLMGT